MAWLGGVNTWFQNFQPAAAAVPDPVNGGAPSGYPGGFSADTQVGTGIVSLDAEPSLHDAKPAPEKDESAKAASEVSTLARSKLKTSWKALQDELATLLRIWKSTAKTLGPIDTEIQRERESLQRSIQEAVRAAKGGGTRPELSRC